jgi:thiol:disulfide interchange protein DsbD
MKKHKWLLVLFCLITACAKTPTEPPAANANANSNEPPKIRSTDVVKATPQEATITRGDSADVVVPINITHGYHVNANPPTFPYLKATELELPQTDGISVEFIRYPDPQKKKFSFAEQELAVYEGEVIVKAHLKADKSAQSGKRNLSAKLRVQACDDKICYAPGVLDLTLPVEIK